MRLSLRYSESIEYVAKEKQKAWSYGSGFLDVLLLFLMISSIKYFADGVFWKFRLPLKSVRYRRHSMFPR